MGNVNTPEIEVYFKSLAVSAIQRSSKGIVSIIVKEPSATFEFREIKSIEDIGTGFSEANIGYIKDLLNGKPSKIYVYTQKTGELLADVLKKTKLKFFNWIGLAEGTPEEQDDLVSWIKSVNQNEGRVYKGIVFNATVTDDIHVVNVINPKVKPKNKAEITTEKYISRLLGVFAGLPFTQSATYYILQDLESVTEPEDIKTAVNAGKLVLFNDEFNFEPVVRINRAVNSLVTVGEGMSDEWKKITIVEAMDLMITDIKSTFKNFYLGKYKNFYDNQSLFISAVNSYFRTLATESILDPNANNFADVNIEKQRLAWLGVGRTEAEKWTDIQVKMNTFRSNIFLSASAKILDAIEDLDFVINM